MTYEQLKNLIAFFLQMGETFINITVCILDYSRGQKGFTHLKTGVKPTEFKRLCGVHHQTFERMVEVLTPQLERTGKRGGQL